jgi:catechol 2,3-dioxygenase-like lactoylglutathione lyase family enzyme
MPMHESADLGQAHLRITRPTDDLVPVVQFYRDGLGMELLFEFHDHDGFDGVMLGHKGAGYHLEFTRKTEHKAGRAPTQEHLLVFYLPDFGAWQQTVARLEKLGHTPVKAFNPYWDRKGKTFEDPDGYRIVLQNTHWPV